jgi:hypothetical protein
MPTGSAITLPSSGGGFTEIPIANPAAAQTKSAKEEAYEAFCAFVQETVEKKRGSGRSEQIIRNADFAKAASDLVSFMIKTFGGLTSPKDWATDQRSKMAHEVMDALKRNPKPWPMKTGKVLKAWF